MAGLITISATGAAASKTSAFLAKLTKGDIYSALDSYGKEGVRLLSAATPKDSGATAAAWRYEITRTARYRGIVWTNDHIVDGRPIAIMLQYGHGTGTGGFVQGRDYINPVIKPLFDKIADNVWKVVTNS
jgi:hypothetical protein